MPTIYDNIDKIFIEGLRGALADARSADFCVGYFNLRGWGGIAADVEKLPNGCRLLIGMSAMPENIVRRLYNPVGGESDGKGKVTQRHVTDARDAAVAHFVEQLVYGCPTAEHQRNLKKLARQLRENKVQVKFHGRYALHAKLYLVHRQDTVATLAGFVGSSNLTFPGLKKNGELNIDVLDQDAAQKLSAWFDARWEDEWSIDVSEELADVIENSWAEGPVLPYHIYLKTAWHLSQDAVTGATDYPLPHLFRSKMLDFQARGVELAASLLNKQDGVIIGDVVGLGKTIIASAVAKTFLDKEDGGNVLVVCPPKLQGMWEGYLHDYEISGKTWSNSSIALSKLGDLRRFKLLIVDESHNFRNRDSKRFVYLRNYIAANESRVILLTATPYNMAFTDIANQLRLFINPDKDLGVRPDNMLRHTGLARFRSEHPNTRPSSLAAFEQSEYVDDWRELMRLFMVRRTRAHIKEHYAEYDEERKRHYLVFRDGGRFYFPDRIPKRLAFSLKVGEDDDDYAKLYSPKVVDIIGELMLPRYGLAEYLRKDIAPAEKDEQMIKNLTRAGPRLRGFTRSGLFKRLESGGDAFLLSIGRHILRNNIHLAALSASDGALPIGQINLPESEKAVEEMMDVDIADGTEYFSPEKIYQTLQIDLLHKYGWMSCDYFKKEKLIKALQKDNALLEEIRALVPQWRAEKDRKLQALFDLVQKTHSKEKVLIFSQYRDTVNYLHRELSQKGVSNLAAVHGGSDGIQNVINQFSPRSNNQNPGLSELRVLIATDALSEGQNLQDAHIVVNYDLPWALIRLVQRAGRVDRIGQTSPIIYCYSAMPEEGIEQIITLRTRLRQRMKKNTELIGSDERFFEGDKVTDRQQLQGLYDGSANLEEPEDETDLISRAYDIWQRATKGNDALVKKIRKLPDVVYSAKTAKDEKGVIAYIRNGHGHDILAHIDEHGEIISQAQAHILDLLECAPDTAAATPVENHHDLVIDGVRELEKNAKQTAGGQLGGRTAVRQRLHERLGDILKGALALSDEEKKQLKDAHQSIYERPLTETSRDIIRRLLKERIGDRGLYETVISLHERKALCPDAENKEAAPHVICSMGLVK